MKEPKRKLTLSLSCSEKFFRSLLLQRSNLTRSDLWRSNLLFNWVSFLCGDFGNPTWG